MSLLPVLASRSAEAYHKGAYGDTLDSLNKLAKEGVEGTSILEHNLALADFAWDKCKNTKGIIKRLSDLLSQAGCKLKRDKRPRRLVVVNGKKGKSSSSSQFLPAANTSASSSSTDNSSNKDGNDLMLAPVTKPGVALIMYNLAALLLQGRHTSLSVHYLEHIFEHHQSADIDVLIVLRACILLLEVYSTMLRGCGCLHSQRVIYLERAAQVIEYCNSKHSLTDNRMGGSSSSSASRSGGNKKKDNKKESINGSILDRQYRLRLNMVIAKVFMAVEDLQQHIRKSKRPLATVANMLEQQSSKNDLVGISAAESWNDPTSDFHLTLQMLRANQEYLRHDYRKSVKFLHSVNASGPLQALFYNNMGCIHFKLHKYTSAAFYFTRALQFSVTQKQRAVAHESGTGDNGDTNKRTMVPAHSQRTSLGNHGEVSFNNGMALLATKDYVSAFKCFQKAVFVFSSWPCLWFRMAQCCIKSHRVAPVPLIKAALGAGRLHRFLLSSSTPTETKSLTTTGSSSHGGEDGYGNRGVGTRSSSSTSLASDKGKNKSSSDTTVMKFMTLEHAHHYLQNALVLIDRFAHDGRGRNEVQNATNKGGKQHHLSSGHNNNNHNNNKGSKVIQLLRVKQAVLVHLAYVSLCLSNPVQTVRHAQELLTMPDSEPSACAQARLYCAEAQCLLSRVAEAQRTLAEAPPNQQHQALPTPQRVATLIALANAHVLQQQLDEAEAVVRRAHKLSPGCIEAIRLMIYINLKRGRTAKVLRLIKTQEAPSD